MTLVNLIFKGVEKLLCARMERNRGPTQAVRGAAEVQNVSFFVRNIGQ